MINVDITPPFLFSAKLSAVTKHDKNIVLI
jgi:hypothetical protein